MNSQSRKLFLILFGAPLLLAIPVVLLGSSIFQAGTIEFEVHEKHPGGCSLEATIPAALVPVAMRLAPAQAMHEVRAEIDTEIGDCMKIARAVLKEISRCPDGVFVDVRTACEVVTVEKRNGRLEVTVDTPHELVRASVPLHTVASVLSAI